MLATIAKFTDGKHVNFTFLNPTKTQPKYLAWIGSPQKLAADIDTAAEVLRYRLFSHGLFWYHFEEAQGGYLTQLEWKLLFKVLILAARDNGELCHSGHPQVLGLFELLRVVGMASTGQENPHHWATISSSINPTGFTFEEAPVLDMPGRACQPCTSNHFAITPLVNFDQSLAVEYVNTLATFASSSSGSYNFLQHFFSCFMPLHRFHLLWKQQAEFVPTPPPTPEVLFCLHHLLITPFVCVRFAQSPVEEFGGQAFVDAFTRLGAAFQKHGQAYDVAKNRCTVTDSSCPCIHEESLLGVDRVFQLFEPFVAPSATIAEKDNDEDDDDPDAFPLSPPPQLQLSPPVDITQFLMVPLLEQERLLADRRLFSTAKNAAAVILDAVSDINIHHFAGYCITLRALNELAGMKQLQASMPDDIPVKDSFELSLRADKLFASPHFKQHQGGHRIQDVSLVWTLLYTLQQLQVQHTCFYNILYWLFAYRLGEQAAADAKFDATAIADLFEMPQEVYKAVWNSKFLNNVPCVKARAKFAKRCAELAGSQQLDEHWRPTVAKLELVVATRSITLHFLGSTQAKTSLPFASAATKIAGHITATSLRYNLPAIRNADTKKLEFDDFRGPCTVFLKEFDRIKQQTATTYQDPLPPSVATAAASAVALLQPVRGGSSSSSSSSSSSKRKAVVALGAPKPAKKLKAELQQMLEAAQLKNVDLACDLAKVKAQLEATSSKKIDHTACLQQLQAAKDQLRAYGDQLQAASKVRADLESASSLLVATVKDQRTQLDRPVDHSTCLATATKLRADLDAANTKHGQLSANLDAANTKLRQPADHSTCLATATKLRAELDAAKKQHAAELLGASSRNLELETDLKHYKMQLDAARKNKTELQVLFCLLFFFCLTSAIV